MAKILIIGGTRFMGYYATAYALARGHEVTLFNRGQSTPAAFSEAEHLIGDRANDVDLAQLRDRQWDAVIDTCGYVPRVVRKSAALLADNVKCYMFISSISAYANLSETGVDESGALQTLADPTVEEVTGETYGGLKVLCEQVVEQTLPGRAIIVRPGLIVGPRDATDRFGYWPRRIAAGGEVLAPDQPNVPIQFIDARDLGEWVIRLIETQHTGVYNATGLPIGLGTLLTTCQEVSGGDAQFTWVTEEFLTEQKVEGWSDLPLWLPKAYQGHNLMSVQKAITAGLTYRPLAETVRATLAWINDHPLPQLTALSPEREHEILALWHSAGH